MKSYKNPAQLLQRLLQFDTTNPPGNEAECIRYVQSVLDEVEIASTIVARDAGRPNLVARLPGRGDAAPLLLQGHVDVVTTAHQDWQYPPFAGTEADGFIWGRGALDMKGGVAMMLAAFTRARAEGSALPGDVILTILSDEEVGGTYGARYLVEKHAYLFEGVRYALGEFGGFTLHLGGKRFYPIQVLEKQCSTIQVTLRGPAGHGSLPLRGGAMAKLGSMLQRLDNQRLPVHIVPVIDQMIRGIATAMPEPLHGLLMQLLDPQQTDSILDMLGSVGETLDALLHNTVNATIVQGGEQFNVIPSQVVVKLDGRLLPGFTPEQMLTELQAVIGNEAELEVVYFDPGQAEADLGLYETLAQILREGDPAGVPVPYMMPAVTDGRFFARLGIQTYGFLPVQLPEDFSFMSTIHAANERIPVAAMHSGTEAVYKVLQRFGAK
ncbi:MAG TPA: M20/M25/M40 family metallo-hydrolase [Ktedonobacteraceae bacterium]|nr:M20/M25/M40 family metallo-hydrolase [Ktedonobacteraceae bacterium]